MLSVMFAGLTATAQNWTLLKQVDYSKDAYNGAATMSDATFTVENGALTIVNAVATAQNWDLQYAIIDGLNLKAGDAYKVVVTLEGGSGASMSTWIGDYSANTPIYGTSIPTSKGEVTLNYTAKADNENGWLQMQTGSYVGTIKVYKVAVYYDYVDPTAVFDWTDVTADNHVAKIEGQGFSNVSGAISVVSPAKVSQDWDSQFWFVMNKALTGNAKVKLTFDAKASSDQSLGFGAHGTPDGNNWKASGICDAINVTTAWQNFQREFTGQAGWQSFALDLTKATEVTYDFRNIKIQTYGQILVNMGAAQVAPANEEIAAADFAGVTVSFANSDVAAVLGANAGAAKLVATGAVLKDASGKVVATANAEGKATSIVLFADAQLEDGAAYSVVIPAGALTVAYADGIVWTSSADITAEFTTAAPATPEDAIVPAFSQVVADGATTYYLYNVETGTFMVGANDWGTRASVVKDGGRTVTVVDKGEGLYKIGDLDCDGGLSSWIDGNGRQGDGQWQMTFNSKTSTYTLNNTVAGAGKWGVIPTLEDTRIYFTSQKAEATATTWAFVTLEDYAAYKQAVKDAKGYLRVVDASAVTASAADLDGKTVVIVDAASKEKVLANIGDAHDFATKSLPDLEGSATEYIFGKFAKVQKDGIDGNIYTIQQFNMDGQNFSKWGTQGYVNFQPADRGNVAFALGLGDNPGVYGQDVENGALWRVTAENGAYVIQNVARGTYYNPEVAAANYAEKVLVKLYEKVEFYKPAPEVDLSGDYVLKNVATGLYLGAANDWGTKASAVKHGNMFTLAKLEDGTYTLDSHVSNGGAQHFLGSNAFVDADAAGFAVEQVAKGVYTIKSGESYLATNANDTKVNFDAAEATEAAQWVLISKNDILAQAASTVNPADFTALIADANFSRNNQGFDAWQGDKPAKGGDNANQCVEKWGGNSQTFNSYQTISNLPNGIYKLKVQGYYRYNNTPDNTNDVAAKAHAAGTEVFNSFFYANNEVAPLASIADEAAVATYGKMPFSLGEASAAFSQGLYQNELTVEVTDGELTIGVKKTNHEGCDWTVWDNFELYYMGEGEPVAVPSMFSGVVDSEDTMLSATETVGVEVAEGMRINIYHCPEATYVTYAIAEVGGKAVCDGEIDMTMDSYVAFDAPTYFAAGKQYNVTLKVYDAARALLGTYTYAFKGTSADVIGEADGINSIMATTANGKYIKNGKVVIVKNGKTYSVTGVAVK